MQACLYMPARRCTLSSTAFLHHHSIRSNSKHTYLIDNMAHVCCRIPLQSTSKSLTTAHASRMTGRREHQYCLASSRYSAQMWHTSRWITRPLSNWHILIMACSTCASGESALYHNWLQTCVTLTGTSPTHNINQNLCRPARGMCHRVQHPFMQTSYAAIELCLAAESCPGPLQKCTNAAAL